MAVPRDEISRRRAQADGEADGGDALVDLGIAQEKQKIVRPSRLANHHKSGHQRRQNRDTTHLSNPLGHTLTAQPASTPFVPAEDAPSR
jgi:hypothetical protein